MRGLAFGCALSVALALAACSPKADGVQASSAAPRASAKAEAALDPCSGMFHALCSDKDIAGLGAQMKASLANAAAAVTPEGLKVMAANEESWLEAQRVACNLPQGATNLTAKQAQCLKAAFAARLRNAAAIEKRGGFTFQRVELHQTDKVSGASAKLMGAMAPTTLPHNVSFPRIDGAGPAIEKFNSAMRQGLRFKSADQTEESTTYELGYVGPDLVSVKFDRRDLTVGAAHPNASADAITFNMATGAPVTSGDMFKPNTKWSAFLASRAASDLTKQLQAQDEMARPVDASDIASVVASPKSWYVTDKALVLLFPAGALAPAATDSYQVAIPWRDLKPYLNPKAPGPAKAG